MENTTIPTPKPFPLNKILFLISAVSLLLAGYFIYQTRELQKRLAAIESSQIPTPVEPTSTPADENSVEGSFCGGIAGIPCPSNYKCLLDGNYPDAGGKCQK